MLEISEKSPSSPSPPLVSVILINYNFSQFLPEAIGGVLSQSYPNWELLLIDDGSTDESLQVMKRYQSLDPHRIQILTHSGHQNRGMSASRNLGLTHSRGEYLAFLDSDDVWVPEKLSEQLAIFQERPEIGMVFSQAQNWLSWNKKAEQKDHLSASPGFPTGQILLAKDLLAKWVSDDGVFVPSPSGVMVSRKVQEQAGGFEDHFRGLYEDMVFYAKICLQKPAYLSNQVWYRYRQHEKSCCATGNRLEIMETTRYSYMLWLRNYLQQKLKVFPTLYKSIAREEARLEKKYLLNKATPLLFKLWSRLRISFGLKPLSYQWGHDRGLPIHRYYLEQFLWEYCEEIFGHCLEFESDGYLKKMGGKLVTKIDVLDLDRQNSKATLVADLTKPNTIADETFDTIICTHVLHVVEDLHGFLQGVRRILKPGGRLLLAVPHISMGDPNENELWRFTPLGLKWLLQRCFPGDGIEVRHYGNSLSAAADLRGVVAHEMKKKVLDQHDERFALEVCAVVRKRATKE